MVRTLIGGLVGGLVLFVTGFIFWATPLGEIPFTTAGDAQNAAVQTALAQNLTATGTGTYIVPAHKSAAGAVLYAKGPIATVHFNTRGYSPDDMSMIVPGLILALVAGLLFAIGLAAVRAGRSFAELARLAVLVSLAFTAWEFLGSPIFNHHGWGYFIYAFVAQSVAWVSAGLVIAWFVAKGDDALAREADAASAGNPPRSEENLSSQ
jgi:cytochrome c oxidase assembly factor CtaG